jgi:uncharacterized membrane protein
VAAWAAAAARQDHGDTMSIGRFFKHMTTTRWTLRSLFPEADLARITAAVHDAEQASTGQIVVAMESALSLEPLLDGITPQQRAKQVFQELRVWDTADNNGILLFLLLADRDFEIVADRGIHAHVGTAAWEAICQQLEAKLRENVHADALIPVIAQLGTLLAAYYPQGAGTSRSNELPDSAVVL